VSSFLASVRAYGHVWRVGGGEEVLVAQGEVLGCRVHAGETVVATGGDHVTWHEWFWVNSCFPPPRVVSSMISR
jgi:hypothetical protein